jgi:hypothetical protein
MKKLLLTFLSAVFTICLIAQPTITNFTPASGPVGTTVTITGTGFSTVANLAVFFGATKATISASTATSITVTVPAGATYQYISVTNLSTDLTAYSLRPFTPTFPCISNIDSASLAPKNDMPSQLEPCAVVVVDLNHDGKPDIVVVDRDDNEVFAYKNNSTVGNITFGSGNDFTSGNDPRSVAYGDIDSDGDQDIIVANSSSNTVSFHRNISPFAGAINFSTQVSFTTANAPWGVTVNDIDKDGKLDIIVATHSGVVSVLRNTTTTSVSFAPKVDFAVGTLAKSVVAADLDGDGKTDVAVANSGANNVSILRNLSVSGTISFAPKVDIAVGTTPYSIASGDLDGDNKVDLATANFGSNNISIIRNTSTSGTIAFAPKVDYAAGTAPHNVVIGEINGDGKPDIISSNTTSNNISLYKNICTSGIISFSSPVDYSLGAATTPKSSAIGDLDADGRADVVVTNSLANSVSVFRNKISPILLGTSASPSCFGANGGTGTVTASGGTPSYTYSWTTSPVQTTATASALSAGTYSVTVTDNSGCTNMSTVNITQVVTATASMQKPSCFGGNNGTATAIGAGGTGPYTYSWNTSPVQNTSTAVGLSIGTYTATVTDINGCYNSATTTVTQPALLVANATSPQPACNGNSAGTANATVTGGTTPYSYSWSTTPVQTTANATGLPIGTYTVTVTDSKGCTATQTATVTQLSSIPTSTPITSCSGPCTATASANATGGKTPYTYLWDSGTGNQTTATATALCAGSYSVTITDAGSCSITKTVDMIPVSQFNSQVYLSNIAAIDQLSVNPMFAAYYTFDLPSTTITPNPSNPRNFVDPGKYVRFKLQATNNKTDGTSIVSGACNVKTNSPYLMLTDSLSGLNNIGWGSSAWSTDEFEVLIDPTTPAGATAYVDFFVTENLNTYSTTCIAIPVSPMVYAPATALTIDDDNNPDSQGNNDNVCDPGETIEYYPLMNNVSKYDAEYVLGTLENLDYHPFINIWDGVAGSSSTVYSDSWWNYSFGAPQTINAGQTNMAPEFDFVFDYSGIAAPSTFNLYMVMAGGFKIFNGTALSLIQWSTPYLFDGSLLATGITESIGTSVFSVYPNPNNGKFIIENRDLLTEPIQIKIKNALGKIVYISELKDQKSEIDLKNCAKGIYFIEITKGLKNYRGKIVVE